MRTLLSFSICLFFICYATRSLGQLQPKVLLPQQTQRSTIASGETHRYTLKLNKSQFATLMLAQKGVDVVITTFDAQGNKVAEFDSPNGSYGAEPFTMSSTLAGNYTIEVAPLEKNVRGNYELKILQIKPKAVTTNQQVDEAFSIWDHDQSPGAAVSIRRNGKVLYEKGYGQANLEYSIPITTESIFHVASISKQFTVFSILLLAQEGKLSLDDDIRKYIPEMPDFGKKITLRHLASHTSGLRDQWELLSLAGWKMDDVITQEQLLKTLYRQKALNFDPGEEYQYCNSGFTLLAEVVERVSGKRFAAFTQEHIFTPLGMSHTFFNDNHEKIIKNRAYSYRSDTSGFKKSNLNFANVGATSLCTTAPDLNTWVNNYFTMKVGSKAIFDAMCTPATLNSGNKIECGLGQYINEYKGMKEIQHGGGDAGYRAYETRFPEYNFSVVVLSNVAEFNPILMSHKIVDIYLANEIAQLAKQQTAKSEVRKPSVLPTVEMMKAYEGDYTIEIGREASIQLMDKDFTLQLTDGSPINLTPLSENSFLISGSTQEIEFIKDNATNSYDLLIEHNGKIKRAKKRIPFDNNAMKLSDFAGKFYSQELMSEYDIELNQPKLIRKNFRLHDDELVPVGKDLFSFEMGYIQFIRDEQSAVIGFLIDMGRSKHIMFEKMK